MSIIDNFKKHIQKLRLEEKLVVIASLVTILACFLPWRINSAGELNNNYSWLEGAWTNSGFNGPTWLIAWLIVIFAFVSAVVAFFPAWERGFEKNGITRMAVPFFLGAESFLFMIIAVSVLSYGQYTKELSFGLFIALFTTALITLCGFWGMRHFRSRRKINRKDEFLKFQEAEKHHSGMGYGEEKPAIQPEENSVSFEEETENDEDDDSQQSLNL